MSTSTSFVPVPGFRLAVVGGCGGMGRALVRLASELRLEVAVMDLQRSIDEHRPPDHVLALACDVSSEEQVHGAFARIGERWGSIDGFVNLAGYTGERIRIEDMSSTEWDAIINTDLRGMFLTARAAAPLLRASAAQARCPAALLVSSTFGVRVPHVGYGPYAASKAGVINLVRALATEWAPDIRVNGIAPGVIDTAFLKGGTGRDTKQTGLDMAKFVGSVPLQRLGQPDEIAQAAMFLLGPASSYVSGQTLHVNGGSYMA